MTATQATIGLKETVPLAHPNTITAVGAQSGALRILVHLGRGNTITFPVGKEEESQFIRDVNEALGNLKLNIEYIRDVQTVFAVMGFRPDKDNAWIEADRNLIKAQGSALRTWAASYGKQLVVPLAPGTLYSLFFREMKQLDLPVNIPVAVATILVANYRYDVKNSSPVKFVFERR